MIWTISMITKNVSFAREYNSAIIFISLVILIILWFATREIRNWYWKINERLRLQEEMNITLESILSELKKANKEDKKN